MLDHVKKIYRLIITRWLVRDLVYNLNTSVLIIGNKDDFFEYFFKGFLIFCGGFLTVDHVKALIEKDAADFGVDYAI